MLRFSYFCFLILHSFNLVAGPSDSITIVNCIEYNGYYDAYTFKETVVRYDSLGHISHNVTQNIVYTKVSSGIFEWVTYTGTNPFIHNLTVLIYDSLGREIEQIVENETKKYTVYSANGLDSIIGFESWNSGSWVEIKRKEYFYDNNNLKLAELEIIQNPYDTTYYISYAYDSLNQLTHEEYFQNNSGSNDLSLQYYFDYSYVLAPILQKDIFHPDTNGFSLVQRNFIYYSSTGKPEYEYIFSCSSAVCADTLGYFYYEYTNDSLCLSTSFYDRYNVNDYHVVLHNNLCNDSTGRILFSSHWDSNYPAPIYSTYSDTSYSYTNYGRLSEYCWHKGGSHVFSYDECCQVKTISLDSSFRVVLNAFEFAVHCPDEPVPGTISFFNGVEPYTFVWNSIEGIDDSLSLNPIFSNKHNKVYVITATDSLGSVSSDTVLIKRAGAVTNFDSIPLCAYDTLRATLLPDSIHGALAFKWWQEGVGLVSTSSSGTFIPISAGTYWLSVPISGCVAESISDSISISNLPVPSLGPDTIICVNANLQLDPGTFQSYLWSDASTNATFSINSSSADTLDLIVLVTDINGCSNSDTIRVTIDICNAIDNIQLTNFELFPNPIHSNEGLKFKSSNLNFELIIYDIANRMVFRKQINDDNPVFLNLIPGLYNYTVSGRQGTNSGKLIVVD